MFKDYKSKRAKVAKELAREAKKGQRWMEDVARLTKNNAKVFPLHHSLLLFPRDTGHDGSR